MKKMWWVIFVVILASASLLASCDKNITSGVVIDKFIEAGTITVSLKEAPKTPMVTLPKHIVLIESTHGKKTKRRAIEVPEQIYDRLEIGDFFVMGDLDE